MFVRSSTHQSEERHITMDREALIAAVGQIPEGRWASYGDVAHAAHTNPRVLNQAFIRGGIAGAHRVLKSNGAGGFTALGDPDEVRRTLEREGVEFEAGLADPTRRFVPEPVA